ncbi:MAG: GNAT family N-acetyltransferase [Limnochordales bacterium]|nr:GNAT family N-acetyltransferase [Limnochordales bacterium]
MVETAETPANSVKGRVNVRRATWRDKEQVLNLLQQLQEVTPGVSMPPRYQVGRIFDQHINSPLYALLVAEVNPGDGRKPQLVGVCSMALRSTLSHAGVSALIDEVVVAEEFRQQGVASALLEQAVRVAEAAGCREVEVSTTWDNEPARNLYKKLGFAETGIWLERHFER